MSQSPQIRWLPDLVYTDHQWKSGLALETTNGSLQLLTGSASALSLPRRAALPGFVNGHSHAFQRVLRGRTEYKTKGDVDSFWTWREMMYHAATQLSPEDIYDASRMAFLEMALSGITSVGEFHYLHRDPNGAEYRDPNLLAKMVIQAARDVGLRITLLRVAYARAGFNVNANPRQARFIENEETYLRNVATLRNGVESNGHMVSVGIAPHSIRAVPLNYLHRLTTFAHEQSVPVHMHVSEQPAENEACMAEYGRTPVQLLSSEGLLHERFTAVHAIYLTGGEIDHLASARAMVCACPTTERNLGDGVVPADRYFKTGVGVSLGTDSQIQIDPLEDARELEYHLRLQTAQRSVLTTANNKRSLLASGLFDCSTINGARSLAMMSGQLANDRAADFFTIDLDDPSICGAEGDDLLSAIVFSLSRTAIKDVVVGGKQIIADGRHSDQDEIVQRFSRLQKKLWG